LPFGITAVLLRDLTHTHEQRGLSLHSASRAQRRYPAQRHRERSFRWVVRRVFTLHTHANSGALRVFSKYLMRVLCYQSWCDAETREQLWLCSDAFSAGPVESCNRFYIREDRLTFAFLLDPHMRHIRELDYYL